MVADEEPEIVKEGREENETGKIVECHLNNIVGLTTPGTIKIKGTVQGREVVVYCGATHNFVSREIGNRAQNSPIRDL